MHLHINRLGLDALKGNSINVRDCHAACGETEENTNATQVLEP
jgi:hypothetical protein